MNNYQKGYALEYKTKQALEKRGWLAMRSPASKSPIDILATKDGESLVVQCKKTTQENIYLNDLQDIITIAKKHRSIPLLVYSFHRSPLYAKEIKKPKITLRRLDKHNELEKYLKIREIQDESMIIK